MSEEDAAANQLKPPKLWMFSKRLSTRPGDTFSPLGVENRRFEGVLQADLPSRQLFTAPGRSNPPATTARRSRKVLRRTQNGRQRAQPPLTEGTRATKGHHHCTSTSNLSTISTNKDHINNSNHHHDHQRSVLVYCCLGSILLYPVSLLSDRNPNLVGSTSAVLSWNGKTCVACFGISDA